MSSRRGLPKRRARSVLLVVKELRVDRQDAALALLLELHDAVDRRKDPVAEQLVAPLAQRVAIDTDELHQAVLERIRRQREVGAKRYRRGRHRGLDVDADCRGESLGFLGIQAVLAVESRGN